MAKSIEQRAADNLINALADRNFSDTQFARHILESGRIGQMTFFKLIIMYFKTLSISHKYGAYVHNEQVEAQFADDVLEILEDYPKALDEYLPDVLK